MCSHCFFSVVDKSSTNCYHLVTGLLTATDSKQIVPTSLNRLHVTSLFPVVDKSGTSCYHLVTRLLKSTDSQQIVPTSLILSALKQVVNKMMTTNS